MRPVPPHQLAACLRQVANLLEASGTTAITQARTLAARGYPTATLSTSTRSGAASETTSTERAALDPDPWAGIDDQLARDTRRLWRAALDVEATLNRVLAHAPDDDPTPAGRGPCTCGCGHVCRPDKRPGDRLRSGLAPACYQRWLRWRRDAHAAGHEVTIADYRSAVVRERVPTS